jgi:hypothetical protein
VSKSTLRWELWSNGTRSLLHPYPTENAALASIRAIVEASGRDAADDLWLVTVTEQNGVDLCTTLSGGRRLVDLAYERAGCPDLDAPPDLSDEEPDLDDEPPPDVGPPGSGAVITEYSGFEPGLSDDW